MHFNFNKKSLLFAPLLLLFLISCSALPTNIANNFNQTFKAFKNLIYGYEDYPITQSLVKQIPYASLRMKIGKGPAGLLILESENENESTWVSADNIFITLKEGRIIRAEGLPNNLTDFFSSEPSFKEIISKDDGRELYRYISLDTPEVYNLKLSVTYKKGGHEEVSILDHKRTLLLIEERILNSYIRWEYTNKYWVDEKTGYVWQSLQMIAPNLPPISIQITKKPS